MKEAVLNEIVRDQAAEEILNRRTMLYRIDPTTDARWMEFVERHPRASVFHSVGWLRALQRTYRYQPVVFTTSSPTERLKNGLLFCNVESLFTGNRLVSLPFSDHCDLLCDSIAELEFLIRNLRTVVKDHKLKYVEVRPTNSDFGRTGRQNDFLPATNYFYHTLSLIPDLHELYQGLDKDCVQRRIRRAERAGLTERCGRSEELLKDFFTLFALTRRRHHLPPVPYVWFRNLIECLGDTLQIRMAYKDENPIAAILTLQFKRTLYYKYGCSDARCNNFGATPWLLWNAIVEARMNGALSFDMGRTDEDNLGLLAFKNHWAPRSQALTYWRYPTGHSPVSATGWKLKMAKRIFSQMPASFLRIIGQITYRHIG
jgi:lipid II:glycine glycyltransferase (peptidoglycan interpeptide bridge formation enzyme)